jgi:hypothetical protein
MRKFWFMIKKCSILIFIIFFISCSMDKFIIRRTGAILDYSVLALYEESDLVLAERALASDIKLLEGMIKGDPQNEHLLLLASQSLSGYALAFAEDEAPERAKKLYLRARDFGLKILREDKTFLKSENNSLEEFKNALSSISIKKLDALFWTAFAWAGWINLSLNDPQSFIDLPRVEIMMQRVLDLDETYFHAAAHLFFGSIWGIKPVMLGGTPEKAKEHFEKNIKFTQGKFLLTYIYYIKYYAIKTLNDNLFDQMIQYLRETPADILPGFQLLNMVAKKKAEFLAKKREEFF